MRAAFVSTNSLMYLKEVLKEVQDNGDSIEIDDALELLQGHIDEAVTIESAELEAMLEKNDHLLKSENEEYGETEEGFSQ
jgi:hypothetical protein